MLRSIANSMNSSSSMLIQCQDYQALPLLSKRSQAGHRPVCVAYLHVNELEANEMLSGYP
jgi:hypothetical protein